MISRVYADRSEWAEPPAKFEAGTPPIAEIVGLGAAVRWVEALGWGRDRGPRPHARGVRPGTGWGEVPGLTVYGPDADGRAALASFTVDGAAAEDLNFLLDRRGNRGAARPPLHHAAARRPRRAGHHPGELRASTTNPARWTP